MNRTFKAAVAALMFAVGSAGSVAAGPFEDATAAYNKGDHATALRLYRSLAEPGDASAQDMLGRMYDHGRGVPQDYAAALRWYRKAAEQGYAPTQVNLGVVYFEGHGVPQDYAATVKWFRLAAEQDYAIAQSGLGVMYGKGLGVPQDYVQAHMWLNLAAAQGYKDAATSRDNAATFMTPAQMAEAQMLAREWRPKMTNAGRHNKPHKEGCRRNKPHREGCLYKPHREGYR
jgi:TPR repeat protein